MIYIDELVACSGKTRSLYQANQFANQYTHTNHYK